MLRLFSAFPSASLAACNPQSWTCTNGDCIDATSICDGTVDCADRSDETPALCSANSCPKFAFRCAYGACVAGQKECNGIADCADGSDEVTANCPAATDAIVFACDDRDRPNQFRCRSGDQCVSGESQCDGKRDCRDGSDETVELCVRQYCPRSTFRCAYGGCVSGRFRCDGKVDCADGSDELASLCQSTAGGNSNSVGDAPTRTPPTVASTAPQCVLQLPRNMRATYAAPPFQPLDDGTPVASLVSLVLRCADGWSMHDPKLGAIEETAHFCLPDGSWASAPPLCERRCSAATLAGASTQTDCDYQRISIACTTTPGGGMRPGTIARVRCRHGYRKPDGAVNDLVVCGADGLWNRTPMRCEQVCGVDGSPTGTAYIVGGEVTNNTLVPWHVGVYSDVDAPGSFSQICGGTILTNRLVISAAHCFWSKVDNRFQNVAHFRVAMGKYYRSWDAAEPLSVQRLPVQEIRGVQGYADHSDLYNADLVLLVLPEVIQFRSYVVPICVELNLQFNDRFVVGGLDSLVAGWGLTATGGASSDVLKVISLPTVSFDECRRKVPASFQRFVTTDKFCAGFLDRAESVCQGDSGGGLVTWREAADGQRTFFLRGLVSSGVNRALSCDSDKYTVFTNVHYYSDLIASLMSDLESRDR